MERRAPTTAFDATDDVAAGAVDTASAVRRLLVRGFGAVGAIAAAGLVVAAAGGALGLVVAFVGAGIAAAVVLQRVVHDVETLQAGLEADLRAARAAYDRASLDARLDPLTGLGNHRAFQEELVRQVAVAVREERPVSLVMIDLDDLKRLNDTDGHAAGDHLLAMVGRLIRATLRPADRSFRIGGDEFALLLPSTNTEAAYGVVRRLLASATGGHPILHETRRFSFSAGISTCPTPSADAVRLSHHADAALYWAKRHGRTDIQVFDPIRHGAVDDERSVEELGLAVATVTERRQLRPVYQPIISLATGEPVGFEGLVRPAPGSSFANAQALFTAAEITDRTVELDMAAIETIAAHVERLAPGVYLGLNFSPRTLETDQFHVGELVGILRRYRLSPEQIVVELTEREAIEDLGRLKASLARVQAAGMRIAADDVGAGNAGLRLLSEIAFDVVKIDLSLVQRGLLQESSLAVLRGLREMARRSGATVVAEGVETPEQLVALRRLGITAAQGYLLGRPGERAVATRVDLDLLASMSNLDEAAIAS
ncbi:MAG: bifunctional diguanylate cyclase/phosphodiesterase [Chloroflexi bacterium]|nr:bifunctional diguanylate cyclase/phosphodiesterase [Chloroflexota bacterium]